MGDEPVCRKGNSGEYSPNNGMGRYIWRRILSFSAKKTGCIKWYLYYNEWDGNNFLVLHRKSTTAVCQEREG